MLEPRNKSQEQRSVRSVIARHEAILFELITLVVKDTMFIKRRLLRSRQKSGLAVPPRNDLGEVSRPETEALADSPLDFEIHLEKGFSLKGARGFYKSQEPKIEGQEQSPVRSVIANDEGVRQSV